jgi:hypothetical protein
VVELDAAGEGDVDKALRVRTGSPPGSRLQRPTMKVDTLSSNWNLARIPR